MKLTLINRTRLIACLVGAILFLTINWRYAAAFAAGAIVGSFSIEKN